MAPTETTVTAPDKQIHPVENMVMTRAVSAWIVMAGTTGSDFVSECLRKHMGGDWGLSCEEDAAANDERLPQGGMLMSAWVYDGPGPKKDLWVISDPAHEPGGAQNVTALVPAD